MCIRDSVKTVARVQETEIIAAGKGDALIHSVIQSFVPVSYTHLVLTEYTVSI